MANIIDINVSNSSGYNYNLPVRNIDTLTTLLSSKIDAARFCLGLYTSPFDAPEDSNGVAALISQSNSQNITNALASQSGTTQTVLPPNQAVPPGGPAWMQVAKRELGINEKDNTDRIHQYFASTDYGGKNNAANTDGVAWCSAFANWVMQQVGIVGTKDARAVSWASWGRPVTPGTFGSIVVFQHHVTFCISLTNGVLKDLGGNQGSVGTVTVSTRRDVGKIIGWRWPSNM